MPHRLLPGSLAMTFGFATKCTLSVPPHDKGKFAGVVSGLVIAAALPLAALAEPPAIPNLASVDFGWQSNVADWQEPPPGFGRGPIQPDPAHPFTSNAEGF